MPPKTKKISQFLNQKTLNDDFEQKNTKLLAYWRNAKKKKKQTYEPRCWIEQWKATKTLTLRGSSSPFFFFDCTTTHVFSLFLLSSFLLSSFSLSFFLFPSLFLLSSFSLFFFLFPFFVFACSAHTHSPKKTYLITLSILLALRTPTHQRKYIFSPFQFSRPHPLSKTSFYKINFNKK